VDKRNKILISCLFLSLILGVVLAGIPYDSSQKADVKGIKITAQPMPSASAKPSPDGSSTLNSGNKNVPVTLATNKVNPSPTPLNSVTNNSNQSQSNSTQTNNDQQSNPSNVTDQVDESAPSPSIQPSASPSSAPTLIPLPSASTPVTIQQSNDTHVTVVQFSPSPSVQNPGGEVSISVGTTSTNHASAN